MRSNYPLAMTQSAIDPTLVLAWLTARSVARGLPAPVADRGGFRVDTDSEKEVRRWVFPIRCEGLSTLGNEVIYPRHFLKLCGTDDDLRNALPANWEIQPAGYFMATRAPLAPARPVPDFYQLECHETGPVFAVRVTAPDGSLAASGCAAEAAGVFIYDRIETAPPHRRRGLGTVIMNALASARKSHSAPQLLVATDNGLRLYMALGWAVLSPYSTAAIPFCQRP
jgi:GNAT superfamily N-acetyltransferase